MNGTRHEWDRSGSTFGMDDATAERYRTQGYDPVTASLMHGLEASNAAMHEANRRNAGASSGYAYGAPTAGASSGFQFMRGLAKLGLLMVFAAAIVGYLPVDKALRAGALTLSGVAGFAPADSGFYEASMPVELSRTLEQNLALAQPAIEQFRAGGILKESPRASTDAFLAAIVQGYRFDARSADDANSARRAVQFTLERLHKQTGSPVPLEDLGFAMVAASGDHLNYADLRDRHGYVASKYNGSVLFQERQANLDTRRFTAALVLDGLGQVSAGMGEAVRTAVRYGLEKLALWRDS